MEIAGKLAQISAGIAGIILFLSIVFEKNDDIFVAGAVFLVLAVIAAIVYLEINLTYVRKKRKNMLIKKEEENKI